MSDYHTSYVLRIIKILQQRAKAKYFERQDWLNNYVWTEYTIDEIAAGIAFNRLTSKL